MRGDQRPRVCHVPEFVSSAGDEAIDLCRMVGLGLDESQQFVLVNSLGERANGRWAAFEVAVMESRQNGKGCLFEARELTGLFVLKERLLIHSAHQFDTSLEAFRRLLDRIESHPDLERRVKRVSRSHGEEGIELVGGQRIRFRTRTKGGGRGFTADWVGLDEAMILPETTVGALLPTLSARPNPQVWYAGSAVDQQIHEHGTVFARLRDRALKGDDPSLAYFEWSVDAQSPDDVTDDMLADPVLWAQANPALGDRISVEHVEKELRSMDRRTFAVERLGVGDWPATGDLAGGPIGIREWMQAADPRSSIVGPVCFAFDVRPDRGSAVVCAAGRRADGGFHVEVVDRRHGTGWVIERVAALVASHETQVVVCDGVGPASSLVPDLLAAGVAVETVSTADHARACGFLFDCVQDGTVKHLGTSELASAVKGASTRPLGDAWAWSRKSSSVDISPLVGCTLALWAARESSGVWVGW